jgi:hypothetical protein
MLTGLIYGNSDTRMGGIRTPGVVDVMVIFARFISEYNYFMMYKS